MCVCVFRVGGWVVGGKRNMVDVAKHCVSPLEVVEVFLSEVESRLCEN